MKNINRDMKIHVNFCLLYDMRFVRLPQENVHIYAFTSHNLYCQKLKCYQSLPLTCSSTATQDENKIWFTDKLTVAKQHFSKVC